MFKRSDNKRKNPTRAPLATRHKTLRRRSFLKGIGGVTLALPFLEGLAPLARAQSGAPPRRLIIFFECNGVNMERFWPLQYGPLTADSFGGDRSTAALAPWASKLLIPRGLHTVPGGSWVAPGEGCDHQRGMAHKLTAQPLIGGGPYAAGISVDQYAAQRVNPNGAGPLTLMVGQPGNSPTAYISYRGSEQPVQAENNPWRAYSDLIALNPSDAPTVSNLALRRQSVLDLVKAEMDDLKRAPLSAADIDKLDMHYDAIRDVEITITNNGLYGCALPDAIVSEMEGLDPNTIQQDHMYPTVTRLQTDILAIAIACQATNVASLQIGTGAGGPVFTWDGMDHPVHHHALSHGTLYDNGGQEVAGYEEMLADIDAWHARQFAYLLERLESYTEEGGTVLDNSCVAWMNELSDGKAHHYADLPVVLAGSCGGYFRQGEYIRVSQSSGDFPTDAPHNKLLVMMLNAIGVTADGGGPVTNFGHPDWSEPGEYDELKAS